MCGPDRMTMFMTRPEDFSPMPRAEEEMGNDGGTETTMPARNSPNTTHSRASSGRSKSSSPRRKGAGARGYPAGRSLMG